LDGTVCFLLHHNGSSQDTGAQRDIGDMQLDKITSA
jgi:hypothetical protein